MYPVENTVLGCCPADTYSSLCRISSPSQVLCIQSGAYLVKNKVSLPCMPCLLSEAALPMYAAWMQVLSSERLEQGGVYLVENGFDAVLHLHRGVDPSLVQQLLGVSSYDELLKQTQPLVLLPNDSPASKALQDILSKVGRGQGRKGGGRGRRGREGEGGGGRMRRQCQRRCRTSFAK